MNDIRLQVVPSIELQDEHGRALVEFHQADETHSSLVSQTSELDASSVSQFNHLLGLVPSSAASVSGNSSQLMTCTFEYSKLVQAKDGSGAIGAVYKEGSKKFGAQARFHEAKDLKSVVTTGLALNIASQVLAQKHLADINERLKSIEQQVKGIQEHLERSRFAKIEVFQEHLQRLGTLISQGEPVLADSLQVLAQRAQEVRAEVNHIRRDLEDAHTKVRAFDSSSWFGSDNLREALQGKIWQINHLQREYLLGMQCLVMANLILFIKHGGNKEFLIAGDTYLAELSSEDGLMNQWNATKRRVSWHLSKMKPVFELAKSTQANAVLVEAKLSKVQQQLDEDVKQVRELQQRLVLAQNPRLLLVLEGGLVKRGHFLQ